MRLDSVLEKIALNIRQHTEVTDIQHAALLSRVKHCEKFVARQHWLTCRWKFIATDC